MSTPSQTSYVAYKRTSGISTVPPLTPGYTNVHAYMTATWQSGSTWKIRYGSNDLNSAGDENNGGILIRVPDISNAAPSPTHISIIGGGGGNFTALASQNIIQTIGDDDNEWAEILYTFDSASGLIEGTSDGDGANTNPSSMLSSHRYYVAVNITDTGFDAGSTHTGTTHTVTVKGMDASHNVLATDTTTIESGPATEGVNVWYEDPLMRMRELPDGQFTFITIVVRPWGLPTPSQSDYDNDNGYWWRITNINGNDTPAHANTFRRKAIDPNGNPSTITLNFKYTEFSTNYGTPTYGQQNLPNPTVVENVSYTYRSSLWTARPMFSNQMKVSFYTSKEKVGDILSNGTVLQEDLPIKTFNVRF